MIMPVPEKRGIRVIARDDGAFSFRYVDPEGELTGVYRFERSSLDGDTDLDCIFDSNGVALASSRAQRILPELKKSHLI